MRPTCRPSRSAGIPVVSLLLSGLAALGRRSTRAVALSAFIGLIFPPVAALLKPLLVPSILIVLAMSFMRTDTSGLLASRRLGLAAGAVLWIMVVLPGLAGMVLINLPGHPDPGIVLALLLQAAAAPIMSAPAFAALLGLDAPLTLLVMVASMVISPITAPLLVGIFSGGALTIDPIRLAERLAIVLAGTAAAGLGFRAWLKPPWLARWRDHLDGINVILLAILVIALMDGVTARAFAQPWLVLGIVVLAFAVALAALALTVVLFRTSGRDVALVLAFSAAHRNMSMMLAATGAVLPDTTWLYVALAQFPIFILPDVIGRFARSQRPE